MRGILLLFLFAYFSTFGQDFKNIKLLDNWTDNNLVTSSTTVRYNECWSFTQNGSEYAVIGSTEGTHFFEITEDDKLKEIDFVRGKFSSAQVVHRDFKTYKNFLYAVCDEGESSLQIIDLQHLPDSVHVVSDSSHKIGRSHNIFIDEENELLYAFTVISMPDVGANESSSMKVFSLNNPLNPQLLFTGPNDIPEVHDGYIRDNIAILNCGDDGLRRYDFSDPTNPIFLQSMPIYQEQGYNHQGWLNPKGDVYIFADETNGKLLKKCKVRANGEIEIESYFGVGNEDGSVPHNIMLDDQFAYVAYYNYGLRIFDYTKKPIEQVAFYDTYPNVVKYQLNGAWGVNSLLPSNRILISDRTYGLFLFDFNKKIFQLHTEADYSVYPNPVSSGESITFVLNTFFKNSFTYSLYDLTGKIITSGEVNHFNFFTLPIQVSSGRYTLKVNYIENYDTEEIIFPLIVN